MEEPKQLLLSQHRFQIDCLKKQAKLNQEKAEQMKIKDLVLSDHRDLTLVKRKLEELQLDARLRLLREEAKQSEIKHDLTIRLPTQLECRLIERASESRQKSEQIRLEADVFRIGTLGAAQVYRRTLGRLVEAQGLRQLAEAYEQYYTALVFDRFAGGVLRLISHRYNLDPQFRIRLEWPLREESLSLLKVKELKRYFKQQRKDRGLLRDIKGLDSL